MPVLVSAGQATVPTYALLDSGATCNAITESMTLQIQAPVKTASVKLGTFSDESTRNRTIASFTVTDLNEKINLKIENALVGEIFSAKSEFPDTGQLADRYPHLRNINFPSLEDKSIGVIIGAKFASQWLTGKIVKGKSDEPVALFTPFGPTLVGPITQNTDQDTDNNICAMSPSYDDEYEQLSDNIRMMFRHDFITTEKTTHPQEVTHPSVADELSLETMKKSLRFDKKYNQYVVDLPWIHGREKTAKIFESIDFWTNAVSRLNKLKAKFEKDPWLKEGSFAQIRETIELGHSRVLTDLKTKPGSPVCYLPNLVVLHPDKPGKFRVCQDAAAEVKGHSLNNYLHSGPDNMNNIIGILTRSRRGKYIVTADIKNFFYMIRLNEKDAPALRYLWWEDETMTKMIILEGTVYLFGIKSSPSIATFTLRAHIDSIKDDYPKIIREIIFRSMFVDDLMHSFDKEKDGAMIKKNLNHAVERGGFQLLKWKSNCPGLSDPEPSTSPPSISPAQDDIAPATKTAGESGTQTCDDPEADTDRKKNHDAETLRGHETEESVTTLVERSFKGEANEDRADLNALTKPDVTTKLLGIGFDYETDEFFIKIRPKHAKEIRTKA